MAIDLASTSVHLLVARPDPAELVLPAPRCSPPTYGMREARIRLLATGAAVIETVLERVGMEFGRVVDTGIRKGAIIAADRAGEEWRDRLEELAHGWIA